MSGRPPLANLVAIADTSPANLDSYEAELGASGEFARVWRPAPNWVAAVAPLPGSPTADPLFDRHSLAFVEGGDVVAPPAADRDARLARLAAIADERPDSLAQLPGDFGFVRFRPHGEATVVRSCGGLVPFYFAAARGCRVLATRLGEIVRFGPDEPRLDPMVNAIWAASWIMLPDRRTFLDGVSILPQGHYARVGGSATDVGRYWHPRPRSHVYPTPAQRREHADALRASLLRTLERDLDPGGGNLLTLSGGNDSSTLLALGAGVLGRRMQTLSIIPGSEDARRYELSFIEPLLERFPVERRWIEATSDWRYLLDIWREAPPVVFHVIHPALCSLRGLMREAPVRVLVGGEYADQTCGQLGTAGDWARATPPWRAVTTAFRADRPARFAAGWLRRRVWDWRRQSILPFPPDPTEYLLGSSSGLLDERVREECRAWWQATERRVAADREPWRDLAAYVDEMSGAVPMNWEACSALGIRRSFPFFNREVLELAFTCHPSELYGPGVKQLLKAAVQRDVPARNLNRVKDGGDPAARRAREAVTVPMTAADVPDGLSAILDPRWLSTLPATLDYGSLRFLTRLTLFVDRLRARRAERVGRAGA